MSWLRGVSETEYSDGEMRLFIELQQRKLTLFMVTHRGIELDYMRDGVKGCRPDFLWGPPAYTVFLDGERVHRSDHNQRRDGLITQALERRGFTVDRFRYRPPLSKGKVCAIADAIERHVREHI